MSQRGEDTIKKKIFAVSDIHGHAELLKEALREAGFERDCDEHLLVVCGDCFDRGPENRAVYNYLDSLKNKLLICGNHDEIMSNILYNGKLSPVDFYNGTERTVKEFFRGDYIPEFNLVYTDESCNAYRELRPFLDSMQDYFETENYIFTHGWLPNEISEESKGAYLLSDWRYASPTAWHTARWTEWQTVYPHRPLPNGKTLVVGHRSAEYGKRFQDDRPPKCSEPFFGEGMIAIDALTVVSGRVNVLALEDEIPESATHKMTLLDDPFREIRAGRKTVEMRLFDEKRRKLRPGDSIVFTNKENGETITVRVAGLHRFPDFLSLAGAFPQKALGSPNKSAAEIAKAMSNIYSEEETAKNGTLAIRILKY